MRGFYPPVVGRIKEDVYLVDMFTVFETEIPLIAEHILKLET